MGDVGVWGEVSALPKSIKLSTDDFIQTEFILCVLFSQGNRLIIVDRLKHIFKLSQGEYVAPEKIEQVYSQTPLICQVFVDGSPLRSYPVALVVPDGDALCKALNSLEPEPTRSGAAKRIPNRLVRGDNGNTENFYVKGQLLTLADLCNNRDAERLIHNEMVKLAKIEGLKGFEQVSASLEWNEL